MRPAPKFSLAELFNCCTAFQEPDWSRFTNLELGGCIDAADEDTEGTSIEGGKSRAEAEFFTIHGRLVIGGCEVITDCHNLEDAQLVAARLRDISGLTLEVAC